MFYNEMENNQQTQKDNKENKRKVSEGETPGWNEMFHSQSVCVCRVINGLPTGLAATNNCACVQQGKKNKNEDPADDVELQKKNLIPPIL